MAPPTKKGDAPSSRKPSPYWSYQHKILIYIREIFLFNLREIFYSRDLLHQRLNLREVLLLSGTILVCYHEVIVDRLAILELNNSHATFTELESEVSLTLAVNILSVPLLLTILVVSGNLTIEDRIAVVTEIDEAVSTLGTKITVHIEVLEHILLIDASAGSHQ